MTDPNRLLQDARDLTEPERRALEAARDLRPPGHFAGGVWTALAGKLPGAPTGSSGPTGEAAVGSAGAGGAGAASALGAGTVKALLLGACLGVAVVGGRTMWPTASSPASAPSLVDRPSLETSPLPPPASNNAPGPKPIVEVANPSELPTDVSPVVRLGAPKVEQPLRPTPVEEPNDSQGASRAAAAVNAESPGRTETARPGSGPGAATPITADAREESRLVATAREALRSGAPQQTLALLEQARLRFPAGILLQERDALIVEALVRAGQRGVAAERGRAFAQAYPGSPYTARIQSILAAP